MKALYMYEHSFIPNLIFAEDKGISEDFYQHLLFNFQSLSLDMIQNISKKENVSDIVFATAMKDEFKSEQLSVKEVNGVQYNFLKLFFFFQATPEFSPLCPYSYVVFSNVNGKKVYYYFTIEYDSMINDGNNRGSYWLCSWNMSSKNKLLHKNYGQVKLNEEMIIGRILDTIVDGNKVSSKVNSSNNTPLVRIGPFKPSGWEERERLERERREREKNAEEIGNSIQSLFVVCVIIYVIYLFCK